MYLKSQNEAAVESSRRVPTKDEARKWYADIKPIILCTDQGENDKGVILNQASRQDKQSGLFGWGWIGGLPKKSNQSSLGLFGFLLRHQLIFIMCTPGKLSLPLFLCYYYYVILN